MGSNKVPKKNISRIIRDIKEVRKEKQRPIPHGEPITIQTERIGDWAPRERGDSPRNTRPFVTRKRVMIGLVGLIFVAIVAVYWYGTSLPTNSITDSSSGQNIIQEFSDRFLPFLKAGVQNIGVVPKEALSLIEEIHVLESKWPDLLLHGQGGELLNHLRTIESSLASLSQALGEIHTITQGDQALPFGESNQLVLSLDLERWHSLIHELISWLSVSASRHIAILLLNPSEIRPGGGFLGSFVELTIQNASITNVIVRDINEVDRTLLIQVVPPKPLQVSERRWRTADTNWFFDFKDSAKKTLSFMSSSGLYHDNHIAFDGAIAISPKVVSDILKLTGPLSVAGSDTPLTSDNFIYAIQKSVQQGQATEADSPKAILEVLAPTLLKKINELSSDKRSALLSFIPQWAEDRDAMGYFTNDIFEENLEHYGAAGRVYSLPINFEGDYLAVVNANIGGGKTDLFMRNRVTLDSQIDLKGTVTNHVVIQRSHHGYESPYWWYRVPNQNYMQVFTPASAELMGATGGMQKRILPKVNFNSGSYETDSDLQNIESTAQTYATHPEIMNIMELGKRVFATWTTTALRATSTLTMDYQHRLFVTSTDGKEYTFVLERQMGDMSVYHITLNAPVGYVWAENNLSTYEYISDHSPGREVISLTFRKL